MKCPECGNENPEGAKYCSNCLANLVMGAGAYNVPQQRVAPSEWRGRPRVERQDLSRRMEEKSHRIMVEWLVYGGIILVLAVALLLSVTVWGNPMPEDVTIGFIQALNDKDAGAMKEFVYLPQSTGVEARIDELLKRSGTEGRFSGLTFSTTEDDYYTAAVFLTGGTYSPGGTRLDVEIDPARKLFIGLESHEGRWYVDLTQVNIFP